MINNKEKDKILIIDFGSQVTKLIARRIRDYGVFSEVITLKDFNKLKEYSSIKGILVGKTSNLFRITKKVIIANCIKNLFFEEDNIFKSDNKPKVKNNKKVIIIKSSMLKKI